MLEQSLLEKQLVDYYVDFDAAMGKGTGYMREIEKYKDRNQECFRFFKQVYEQNNFSRVKLAENSKIPKIIHQIWIGNKTMPKILQDYQKTWVEHNPDWEYRLWTNEKVKEYVLPVKN